MNRITKVQLISRILTRQKLVQSLMEVSRAKYHMTFDTMEDFANSLLTVNEVVKFGGINTTGTGSASLG